MKKRGVGLADLHYDILKHVLIRVARSSYGAEDFAHAISVCKAFRQFVDDKDVLGAVTFSHDFSTRYHRWEWFNLKGGLVCRCAQIGHYNAGFILGKMIVLSCSRSATTEAAAKHGCLTQENARVSCHMEPLLPTIPFHYDYVQNFLSRTTHSEFQEIHPHLAIYMSRFILPNLELVMATAATVNDYVHRFKAVFDEEERLRTSTLSIYTRVKAICIRVVIDCNLDRLGVMPKWNISKDDLRCTKAGMHICSMVSWTLQSIEAILNAHLEACQSDGIAYVRLLSNLEDVRVHMDVVRVLRLEYSNIEQKRRELLSRFPHFFSHLDTKGIGNSSCGK